MNGFAKNFRFLLWERRVKKDQWAAQLAAWAGVTVERARRLLLEGDANDEELQRIADATEMPAESLLGDLVEGRSLFKDNVQALLKELGHGAHGELATFVGAQRSTVSRWLSGEFVPKDPERLRKVAEFFGLAPPEDLLEEPLFLDVLPRSDRQRRQWLAKRVESVDERTLRQLFPALHKLLEDE